MLARRIIPTILTMGTRMVKGKGFNSNRVVGHATQPFRIHQQREVDEVCLLDVTATKEGRGPNLKLVAEITAGFFSPLAVGGGVRSADDVRALLRAGADKAVIGTAALDRPELLREISDAAGAQACVVSIDVKGGKVWGRSGTQPTERDPVEWAQECCDWGCGEILLNAIERDGRMCGYDLDLIRAVTKSVDVPVIASGGCGKPEHALEAIRAGADAVATGAALLFTDYTPRDFARHLKDNGYEART